MSFLRHSVLPAALLACLALPAGAVTFLFEGEVASTSTVDLEPGAPAVFPPVGAPATLTFEFDDSDPSLLLDDAFAIPSFLRGEVSVPGFLEAFPDSSAFDPVIVTDTELSFFNASVSTLFEPGDQMFRPLGLNGLRFAFGAPQAAAPTNVGELAAALATPGTTGTGRVEFEYDEAPGTFRFVDLRFSEPMAAVPLPAGLPLLLAGLGGFVALRFRRV